MASRSHTHGVRARSGQAWNGALQHAGRLFSAPAARAPNDMRTRDVQDWNDDDDDGRRRRDPSRQNIKAKRASSVHDGSAGSMLYYVGYQKKSNGDGGN